jgi:hypothetical protein
LEPPIRVGQHNIPHIVMQIEEKDELTVRIDAFAVF